MHLLVGLGNPGPEYERTRHNLGFRVLEHLAHRLGVRFRPGPHRGWWARGVAEGRPVVLLLPQTFMNASGECVGPALRELGIPPSQMIVVCDDMDLPLGVLRLRPQGGHGGHNGLRSVVAQVGEGFPRLRLGIGRPPPEQTPIEYVLGAFQPEEGEVVHAMVERAAEALVQAVGHGVEWAMSRYNGPVPLA